MSNLLYHFVAFVVVAIWGSTFVFTKLLLNGGLSPAQIFTLRFIIAYVLLLATSLSYYPRKMGWTKTGLKKFRLFADSVKDEMLMLGLGISGGSLYFLTENSAMNYTTTTNTSLIVCLCPLFATALISLFYKSERLSKIQILGTLMAALGVVVVVLNGHFVLHLSPLGDALAFAACLCLCRCFLTIGLCRDFRRLPTSCAPKCSTIFCFLAAWRLCYASSSGTGL